MSTHSRDDFLKVLENFIFHFYFADTTTWASARILRIFMKNAMFMASEKVEKHSSGHVCGVKDPST